MKWQANDFWLNIRKEGYNYQGIQNKEMDESEVTEDPAFRHTQNFRE